MANSLRGIAVVVACAVIIPLWPTSAPAQTRNDILDVKKLALATAKERGFFKVENFSVYLHPGTFPGDSGAEKRAPSDSDLAVLSGAFGKPLAPFGARLNCTSKGVCDQLPAGAKVIAISDPRIEGDKAVVIVGDFYNYPPNAKSTSIGKTVVGGRTFIFRLKRAGARWTISSIVGGEGKSPSEIRP